MTQLRRYVSANTDARERQWRHFYYAQDTWRVNSKLTLNYGLRLDIINPQTINEAGNAGFLDLDTGEIAVVGVGDIPLNGGVENKLNWAPRLGATYQITDKTVMRGGYGRSLRHRRLRIAVRPQRHPEPAGARGAGAERPVEFRRVFTLQGPSAPTFPTVPPIGPLPAAERRVRSRAPEQQRPPTVDAFNVTVQHQLTPTMSIEAGYVGNRGRDVFAGDGPAININQASLNGFAAGVPLNNRRRSSTGSDGRRASTTSATAPPTGTTRCRRSSPSGSRRAIRPT